MLDSFGVKHMLDFFIDSIQEHFILEGLELLLSEEPLPVFTQTMYSIGDPDQEVTHLFRGTLLQVLQDVPLLSEGEGTTIVFPHLLEDLLYLPHLGKGCR